MNDVTTGRRPGHLLATVVVAGSLLACSAGVGRTPADLSATRSARNLALIGAAWANDVPRARRLIAAGADVNYQDATRQSAYLIATSEGHRDLLELTLRHGADVASLDSFKGTGLIRAAERGHRDIVGRLLRTPIDVDHVNDLGWTALHEAIILGDGSERYEDTVRLLVAGAADITLPSARDSLTPIEQAHAAGYEAIAATLDAVHSVTSISTPNDALLRAAETGEADQAAVALRAGADIESRDESARTALLLAAAQDRPAVARLLVAFGADVNAVDNRKDTPWLVTGVTGSVPMMEVLLRASPDLTITNRYGGTSLIPASERGHVEYVRRVVTTGVDVNHVNNLGWTALLEAVILGDGSSRFQEIVRILLAAGADPAIADSAGVTAVQHARESGHHAIVEILEQSQ